MKVVRFNDGTYGIRRLAIDGFEFFDFKSRIRFWRSRSSPSIEDCRTDKDTAIKTYNLFTDRGREVKP